MEHGVDCQAYVVVGLKQKLEENKKACWLHTIRLGVKSYPGSIHTHEVSYFYRTNRLNKRGACYYVRFFEHFFMNEPACVAHKTSDLYNI